MSQPFVSRQLGHAQPSTTLNVYAHLFDQAQHTHTARAALDASYQNLTETHDRPAARASGNTRWKPIPKPKGPEREAAGPKSTATVVPSF